MVLFTEKQRITQWWIWFIVVASIVLTVLINYVALHETNDTPSKFASNPFTYVIPAAALLLPVVLLFLFQLHTVADNVQFRYKLFPLQTKWKAINWADVATVGVVKYSPIKEYGGWGRRKSLQRGGGIAYTIAGERGLQFELNDGTKILVGVANVDAAQMLLQDLQTNRILGSRQVIAT